MREEDTLRREEEDLSRSALKGVEELRFRGGGDFTEGEEITGRNCPSALNR